MPEKRYIGTDSGISDGCRAGRYQVRCDQHARMGLPDSRTGAPGSPEVGGDGRSCPPPRLRAHPGLNGALQALADESSMLSPQSRAHCDAARLWLGSTLYASAPDKPGSGVSSAHQGVEAHPALFANRVSAGQSLQRLAKISLYRRNAVPSGQTARARRESHEGHGMRGDAVSARANAHALAREERWRDRPFHGGEVRKALPCRYRSARQADPRRAPFPRSRAFVRHKGRADAPAFNSARCGRVAADFIIAKAKYTSLWGIKPRAIRLSALPLHAHQRSFGIKVPRPHSSPPFDSSNGGSSRSAGSAGTS